MAVFGKLKDKVASQADATSGLVAGAKGKALGKAQGVVQNTIGEIKALGDVLASCGFLIGDIVFEVGLSPKFHVTIEEQENGTADFEKLLANSDSLTKTQSSVVKALQQIYGFKDTVEPQGYTLGQVDIELGIPPTVGVHLISTDSRAFHTGAETE